MPDFAVEEFIDVVPLVNINTSVAEMLRLFTLHQAGRALIVSPGSMPVGVVQLQALLRYLVPPDRHPSAYPVDLEALSVMVGCGVEPLQIIPSHWSCEQVLQAMQGAPPSHWLLQDSEGEWLGLLNTERWWEFWATQTLGDRPSPAGSEVHPSEKVVQSAVVAMDMAQSLTLPTLCQLLNSLPLPLMLQTETGQVIAQNHTWQSHLSDIQKPEELWQSLSSFLAGEAGDWLSSLGLEPSSWLEGMRSPTDRFSEFGQTLSQTQKSDPSAPIPEAAATGDAAPKTIPDLSPREASAREALLGHHTWEVLLKSMSGLQSPGSCRPVPHTNTCVCLCEMEEGGDRIWQFSGTLLGYLPPAPDPTAVLIQSAATQGEKLWLILAQDVTEQHQVAKELAAKNADLMQLNRMKDEFLACISHELRTPLTAVLGLSNLLKDQMIGPLNDRQARYARLIYHSGRHLMMIVNDILDLTQIETGQLELAMEPLSVATVCARALEQAKQMHLFDEGEDLGEVVPHATMPEFTLKIQPSLKTMVADEVRMRQMLANLLSNALKFTDGAGSFGLNVEEWHGWIAFTIWDTGIGIPQDRQHLIFQKFQQLEHPLTRRFEGTGLGLVLTQRLARLHGGDVTFTSAEGKGSEFTLLLPPDPSFRGIEPRLLRQQTETWPGRYLVLVVEAVPQFLEDLQQPLTDLGYRLAIARSGTEALEKARQLQPLMIFLNPVLPQLSGWDVLILLRSHAETCEIPIIITTSRNERGKAFSHGANEFLSVPIQPQALQQVIAAVVSQLEPQPNPHLEQLTILHLRPTEMDHAEGFQPPLPGDAPADGWPFSPWPIATDLGADDRGRSHDLATLLHPYPCRLLEVDDLAQADLLARVWKPNLVLLDGVLPHPLTFMQALGQHSALATLPLITLSPENTQAAHQVRDLSVFPYLTLWENPDLATSPNVAALLAMMCQVAGLT